MQKSITLRAFPPEMNTLTRIKLARAAGFEGIEINLEMDGEYTLESSKKQLARLRRTIEALGMCVSSVYSRKQWQFPITSQKPTIREEGQAILERLAQTAAILGTDTVLVIPGAVDNSLLVSESEIVPYDIAYRNAQASLRDAAEKVGQRYHVYLAVENVWNKFLLSPLEFARFVDETESPWVGAYFDVGNVLRTGFPEHWIRILGNRIKRIHLKDFRCAVDNIGGFVSLLEGDVNWPAVREALVAIGYDSWVTAEVLPAYRYYSKQLIYSTSTSMTAILTGSEFSS